jgi:L-threonylcarbamoyladenylate synthase
MDEFWPGPLTILFEKSELVDDLVTAGSNLVAVRMPSHPIFKQIIDFVGVPIVAPSANLSGKPSPTNASDCFEDLDGRVGIIVDGGQCDFGLESTVIKFTTDNSVKILRPGFVTEKDLSQFVDVEIDDSVLESVISSSETKVESPGMKYKHYSPAAKVEIIYDLDLKSLVLNEKEYLVCFSQLNLDLDEKVLNFKSEDELARNLFSTFRNLDRLNASKIYIEFPKENLALQNRILKATG